MEATAVTSNEHVAQLVAQSGLDEKIIREKIEEKIAKYGGLLTEQGAVVLVSKELNVTIASLQRKNAELSLSEIQPGMKNVDTKATVIFLDALKSFSRNGKEGKFLGMKLSDGKGEALFTLWNVQAEEAVQKGIRRGSILTLTNAMVGSYNQRTQLSLGYNGTYGIDNSSNVGVEERKEGGENLAQAEENARVQVRAHVVDILPGKGYYVKCTQCGAKYGEVMTDCSQCGRQGSVETRLLVPLLIDDGSTTMRAVAFENEAIALFGKKKDEILDAMMSNERKNELYQQTFGKMVNVQGKIKVGLDNVTKEMMVNALSVLPFEKK